MTDSGNEVLVLEASVDITTVNDLCERSLSALVEGQELIIDASGVERIDAAALQWLAAMFRAAEVKGMRCGWQAISDAVIDTAQLCGLHQTLSLEQNA